MRKFHFSFKRNTSNSGSNADPEPEYTCSVGGADSSCVRVRCEECGTLFCFAHEVHVCGSSLELIKTDSLPDLYLEMICDEYDNETYRYSYSSHLMMFDYDGYEWIDSGIIVDTSLLPQTGTEFYPYVFSYYKFSIAEEKNTGRLYITALGDLVAEEGQAPSK
jgi:hypothetical protein